MCKLASILIALILASPVVNAAVKWNNSGEKAFGEVKLWSENSQVPESYDPNLATV